MRGFVVLLVAATLVGCADETLAPSEAGTPGEFLVESYSTSCVLKHNPENGELQAYISFALTYVFKSRSGSINYITFEPVGPQGEGVAIAIDYYLPLPAGSVQSSQQGCWSSLAVQEGDTVTVRCSLEGRFWNRFGDVVLDHGGFTWSGESLAVVRVE